MIPIFIAGLSSFITLTLLLKSSLRKKVVARVNDRSLHIGVIPRFGGLGIVLGIAVGWLLLDIDSWWLVLGLGSGVALVSFLDDMFELPVWLRLSAQLLMVTAFIVVEFGVTQLWGAVFLILAATWMVNLFNFMDGMDGLVGSMSFVGFGTIGFAAFLVASDEVMLKAALVVVASVIAFLRWNLHPARLFMGDVGSTSLGFVASAFALYGWQQNMWPFWFPVLVFLPFIADSTVTLLKRLLKGENIFKAHRQHYYQRMVQMGYSQWTVGLVYLVIMLITALFAISMLYVTPAIQLLGISILFLSYAGACIWLDSKWRLFEYKSDQSFTDNVLNEESIQDEIRVEKKKSPYVVTAIVVPSDLVGKQ